MHITMDNTVFVVLSFEGPDAYSMAGGLGARLANLTQTLARMNFEVHHIFIGDPNLDGFEVREKGRLMLHRWCQWISQYHPNGVYDGEEGKLHDFNESTPPFVVHELAAPAIAQGKLVVILGEEWHTAEAMSRISDLLYTKGLRNDAIMFWNANNTYGFERINWARLSYAVTITTVSKYMKHIIMGMGTNPLVIPNGLPRAILQEADSRQVARLRNLFAEKLVVSKVARWHPDKGWKSAVEAMGRLKQSGKKLVFLARGGIEPYGGNIIKRAQSIGLTVKDCSLVKDALNQHPSTMDGGEFEYYLDAVSRACSGDMLNFEFSIPQSFLKLIYRASDIVLANSRHEPFGLVDLEAMATGAVVFTGSSGEDYSMHFVNAIVLDTFGAEEIEFYANYLEQDQKLIESIRKAARETARQFTWEKIVKNLQRKLEYQAEVQGIVP
jgi:glycosyltransferase involved in cell wall biosynthesis